MITSNFSQEGNDGEFSSCRGCEGKEDGNPTPMETVFKIGELQRVTKIVCKARAIGQDTLSND